MPHRYVKDPVTGEPVAVFRDSPVLGRPWKKRASTQYRNPPPRRGRNILAKQKRLEERHSEAEGEVLARTRQAQLTP